MKERLTNGVRRWYRRLTPRTHFRACWAVFGLFLAFWLYVMLGLGVVYGASNGLVGLADVRAIPAQVWTEMASQGGLAMAAYGLGHWLVEAGVAFAIAGAHIGAWLPEWTYGGLGLFLEVSPWLLLALIGLQIMRALEPAIGAGRRMLAR